MQLENYFNCLAPSDIRLKGTGMGIENIIQPQMATTESVTKQECFQIPGSQSWVEYKGQEKIPKEQRLGTCYHEGLGD